MRGHPEDTLAAVRERIVDIVRQQTGQNEVAALDMAARILTVIHEQLSGERVYFRSHRYNRADVLADFSGRNHREVCRKHGISLRTLYRLLRHETKSS